MVYFALLFTRTNLVLFSKSVTFFEKASIVASNSKQEGWLSPTKRASAAKIN